MKRSHEEEEGHENSERWLLTYSDLITLLLALFIILYTMSSVDLEKFKELSKYLKSEFTHSNVETSENVSIPEDITNLIITDSAGSGASDSSSSSESSTDSTSGTGLDETNVKLDEAYNQILAYIKSNNLEDSIDVSKTSNELKITLKDTVLFYPDSPNMVKNSEPILSQIEKSITGVYDNIDHITISGHTADPNNNGKVSSDFAWQLSINRALAVLNYMKNQGLPEYKLSVEGYSHFIPIASNENPKEIAKNRRVEIIIRKEAKQ